VRLASSPVEALDVQWEYDHEDKSVAISLALVAELAEQQEAAIPKECDRPHGRSQESLHKA
jgi:hypothetical protein